MRCEITTEYIELAQALKWANWVDSGGTAKAVIQNGEVRLNGEVETRRGRKLRPGDRITWQDQELEIVAATSL